MATSTNYGWSEPDNTSLVKDGAQAIRTLGNAIDTSLWNSGYGQAGKNKFINGDFTINQRNTTSTTTSGTFLVDRFRLILTAAAGSVTGSVEQFTPGTAPVAGYEAKQFCRIVTAGQAQTTDRAVLSYPGIENVRTFAGQTVTVSFWAKAATGTPSVAIEFAQSFGTGGSPSATVTAIGSAKTAITTSWARYSFNVAIPSISGKTVGTDANSSALIFNLYTSAGSSFDARTASLGLQNATIDIWGEQVEYGSTATPFQTASGGSVPSELSMAQRYYYENSSLVGTLNTTTLIARAASIHPVEMRGAPTVTISNAVTFLVGNVTATATGSIVSSSNARTLQADVTIGVIVATVGDACVNIQGAGKITVSAEY